MSITRKHYLEAPETKRFGWSYYTEHTSVVEGVPFTHPSVVGCDTIIRGRKLFLFGHSVLDQKIEVLSHETYTTK